MARDRDLCLGLTLIFAGLTLLTSGPSVRQAIGGAGPSPSLNRPQGRTRSAPPARLVALPAVPGLSRGGPRPRRTGPPALYRVAAAPRARSAAVAERRPRASTPLRC